MHYYHIPPGEFAYMPMVDVREHVKNLSHVALRQEISMARLHANIANAMGGKDDGAKPIDPSKLYTFADFLPVFAQPQELLEELGSSNVTMTKATARVVVKLARANKLASYIYGLNIVTSAEQTLGAESRIV